MFCVKIYVSHNTSGFEKNCPKTHNTYYASRAKDTQKFAKKYLRENFANFDQQISAFRGNLIHENEILIKIYY